MKNKPLNICYHFTKQPVIGDFVKVYIGKDKVDFGSICGFFVRIEHIIPTMDKKGNTRVAYDVHTDCVLLERIQSIPFDVIDYFLDVDRVDFK